MIIIPKRKPSFPMSAERAYMKQLRQLVRYLTTAIKNHLPQIRAYLDKHRIDDDSADKELDDIATAIAAEYELSISKDMILKKIKQMFDQVNAMNSSEFQAEIKSALGINIFEGDPWLEKMRGLWARENEVLTKNIADQYVDRVATIVSDAVRDGTLYSDVATDIQAATGITERRAVNIARDQISSLNGQITRARQLGCGITKYQWSTSHDDRVRPLHREYDGHIYSWDNPPSDGNPGEANICRCVAIPVIDTDSISIMGYTPEVKGGE